MESVDPIRVIGAFGIVLALIGLMALGLRYFVQRRPGFDFQAKGGRLQIVESRMIDARRKLVLVKRDKREHLLLLSGDKETVIESFDAAE